MAEIWNPFALAPIRPAFRMDGDAFVFCSGHVIGRVGFWPDPFIRLEGSPDGCQSALGYADFLMEACPLPPSVRSQASGSRPGRSQSRMEGLARRWVAALPQDVQRYWIEEMIVSKGELQKYRPRAIGNEAEWMHPFAVLVLAARAPSFRQLLASNPALASELLLLDEFYPRSLDAERVDRLERLSRRPRLELLERRGFPPRPSVERILRKIHPFARMESTVGVIRDLLRQGRHVRDLERAPAITANVAFFPESEDLEALFSAGLRIRLLGGRGEDKPEFLPFDLRKIRELGIQPPPGGFDSLHELRAAIWRRIREDESVAEVPSENRLYPEPPFEGCEALEPIRDREALSLEGDRQDICLRRGKNLLLYEREIFDGTISFYRAYAPVRATVMLKRSERNRTGWTVGEAAARANGFVPSRLRRDWLRVLAGRRPVTALDRWSTESHDSSHATT